MKKNSCKRSIYISLSIGLAGSLQAQSLSEKSAKTAIKFWPDTSTAKSAKRPYGQGVLLEGMAGVWKRAGDADYYRHIRYNTDNFVEKDGTIKSYRQDDQNMDNLKNARALLLLYRVTGLEKYYKALQQLREGLKNQLKKTSPGQCFFYGTNFMAVKEVSA